MEIHDKIPAKPIWIILWIKCTIEWEFIDDHGISKGLIWEMMGFPVPLTIKWGFSINGGIPKMDVLQWKLQFKWMICSYPYFRKPPYDVYRSSIFSLLRCYDGL